MTRNLRSSCGALSGWLGLVASALSVGCSGPSITPFDLGSGPQPDLTGAAQESYFRLGHFLVGAPAFDICIKGPSDTDFSGPILHAQTMRTGGVSYANVSAYLTVAPTAYSVRAVPGMATDCTKSLGGLPDLGLTPVAQGHHYIIVASGVFSPFIQSTLKFGLIEDDLSTQGGQARLRFINAASELQSAELGFGSGAQYAAQISGAAYGSVGFASGKVYLTTAPLVNATVAVRQSSTSTDSFVIANKVNVAVGTVATAVITGYSAGMSTPLSLVVCNDSAPAVSGFSSCTELP